MAGELITKAYQAQLRSFLMGEDTDWELMSLSGLGVTDVRTSDVARPLSHGEFAGLDLLDGKTLTGQLEFSSDDPAALATAAEALTAAFKPAEAGVAEDAVPLALRLPGEGAARLWFGRPRRVEIDYSRAPWGVLSATWQYRANDPRRYGVSEKTVNLSPPVSSGGRTYDRTYPLAFGSGSSGTETATNSGNVGAHPVWTLSGPLTNPRLENVTTGRTLTTALDLLNGETLVVDFKERTILLGGTASRYSTLTSGAEAWWTLEPGANELRLGADAGAGTASVAFRDAWL